jgi:hypothetical protein
VNKELFELATTRFEDFYKRAEENSSDHSAAASSGDCSKASSSGYSSAAASFGESSTAASSGNSSAAASSGYSSAAASCGDHSAAASSGDYSKASSSGYSSAAASSGDYSKAASSGNSSAAASSGDYSKAASCGNYSKASSSGNYSGCSAIGYRAAVKGDLGNLLMASEYVGDEPVGGLAALVDGKVLKPQCWYIVEKGKWVEVDFTDGVFAYVLKTTRGVKKVLTQAGDVLYVVGDGNGNFAHGATIKAARQDLIYKITAKFDGTLPESATGTEWIALYRSITGACAAGCKEFIARHTVDVTATYTPQQVASLTEGAFGNDTLVALIRD